MGLIHAAAAPVHLTLSRDLRRTIKQGHPWVFRDAIVRVPADAAPGARALLLDRRGKPVARGYLDPTGPLAFRVCNPNPRETAGDAWAIRQLEIAIALRQRLFSHGRTTGFRLVNGEGDGLPGLVVDRYDDTLVLRLDGPAAEGFWNAQALAQWLVETIGTVRRVYQRFRRRGAPEGRCLVGPEPTEPIRFLECGALFTADVVNGQKTGFYLDQRDNRQRLRALTDEVEVLNVFGYTGGFSVAAGLGGARHVTTVDRAAPAVDEATAHWALNELPTDAHLGVTADAFDFLEDAAISGRRYGVVVLDPPSFAPSKKTQAKALGSYTRLVASGARLVAPGGICVAASCSAHVDTPTFIGAVTAGLSQARRRGAVLGVHGSAPDHPAPLACPELRYLKSVILRLDG